MSSMTMRERVARALCAKQGLRWEDQKNYATSANGGDDETEFYFAMADAAIAAMRDPTLEMEMAFYAACDERGNVLWRHGYRAMIDAALSDAPALT